VENARRDDLAIVLDGGGARAAYQVGLLRGLAKSYPDLRLPLITGVSAGAINAAYLAAHPGPLSKTAEDLTGIWSSLSVEQVFRTDARSLMSNIRHWGMGLLSGGRITGPPLRGLMDTIPLRKTLERVFESPRGQEIAGIARNLECGRLSALTILASSYTTGRAVAWVHGRHVQDWERPFRLSRQRPLTVDHLMASAALPLLFPAVNLEGAWYGDGGIRLTTPLSPALHIGARRILSFSTHYSRLAEEAERAHGTGYPPPAQIAGQLLDAIFLDDLDRDAQNLLRINTLIEDLPEDKRHGLQRIDLVLVRPSVDIGRLAGEYERCLPGPIRHMLGGIGTREPSSADLLSLLMFEPEYVTRLIQIGEADMAPRAAEIAALVAGEKVP
jgi:NTE family protein